MSKRINQSICCALTLCRYVKDILKNTSRSVDQVTIQPDGRWELHTKREPTTKSSGFASSDDDDLVEITQSGDSWRMGTPRSYSTPLGGPPQRVREQSPPSAAQRSSGSISGKRPIAAVIDLTSSGDEDDEPLLPAPKRQFSGYAEPNLTVYRPAPTNGYPHA
jgi:E3 SUMO-protein ligase PIAS1